MSKLPTPTPTPPMGRCLSPDVVEQYVIGSLDPDSARFVDTHVGGCRACAAMLAREAKLEVQLHEVAELSRVVPLSSRRRRAGAAVLSVAAALAAGVVLLVTFEREPPADEAPRIARCEDPGSAAACIERAKFDGVITIGPGNELVVPRYDAVPTAPGGTP